MNAPSPRAADWLWFALAFVVLLAVAAGTSLVRLNQFDPLPTAVLRPDGEVRMGGYRFTLVAPLEEVPAPAERPFSTLRRALPGTTWLRAEVDAELLDEALVADPQGCSLELRTDRGVWEADMMLAAEREEFTNCRSPLEPLGVGQTRRVTAWIRVPERDLVNPELVMVLPGLPARAFVIRG